MSDLSGKIEVIDPNCILSTNMNINSNCQTNDFNNTRIDNENNNEVADNINDVGVLDLS